jgi:acetylornithine deacetylase/succinyl-diaminopimelate desuccinylase-like protein
MEFVRVPSTSPLFDSEWETNGLIKKAYTILLNWAAGLNIAGYSAEVIENPHEPDLIYLEVQGSSPELPTVLLYGHMDKQPAFTGWYDFCGATNPVIKDGKLYGRGAADDGYSITTAMLAVKACQEQHQPHGRVVMVLETEEESGSPHLIDSLNRIKTRIGTPSLIICVDSGVITYDRLWLTNSLRGVIAFDFKVQILANGVHSGDASGVVPSSFRIMRQLLDRIEDSETGHIRLDFLHSQLEPKVYGDMADVCGLIDWSFVKSFPFLEGTQPVDRDLVENMINRAWRPTLSVVGANGLPDSATAGNVLRPSTTLRLSIRLPPRVDADEALAKVAKVLTTDVPYGAKTEISREGKGNGWAMNAPRKWLEEAYQGASQEFYGNKALYMGEGGSIPFMKGLQDIYPEADFLVVGLLGPESNAHGPNEMLHIDYYKKLTCCVAHIMAKHAQQH